MLNLKDFVIRCNFAGTETGKNIVGGCRVRVWGRVASPLITTAVSPSKQNFKRQWRQYECKKVGGASNVGLGFAWWATLCQDQTRVLTALPNAYPVEKRQLSLQKKYPSSPAAVGIERLHLWFQCLLVFPLIRQP